MTPTGEIIGAVVEILDGPDAGRETTTAEDGRYVLSHLTQASFTLQASADGFAQATVGVELTSDLVIYVGLVREEQRFYGYVPYMPLMERVSTLGPVLVTGSSRVPQTALDEAGRMLQVMLASRADVGSSLRMADH